MNTIVLGFKDERGKGLAVMLAGPEVAGNDQVGMVMKIKSGGKAPEGIVRLEMFNLQSRMIAMPVVKQAVTEPTMRAAVYPAPAPKLKFNQ